MQTSNKIKTELVTSVKNMSVMENSSGKKFLAKNSIDMKFG